MYMDVLEKQEEKIALIMCKLERMFPPSFFDMMIHLLIHLPSEAKKGCPPKYRWMFPFERKMRTCKGYVKNTTRPEGCIAKRSLDNECLNFCSMYMNDVERNNEMVDCDGGISVFSCKGRLLGSKITCDISDIELEKIHTYVINNCDEMVEFINIDNFYGEIPPALGNCTDLQGLFLQNNYLSGSIPTEIGNLSKIQTLDISSNSLSGSIPASLGNLKSLSILYLDADI